MMIRNYAIYCMLMIAALVFSDARGYVLANFFDSQAGSHGMPNHYHK
jgi:hypothetical protein